MMVVSEVVLGWDVDVLGQHVGQSAASRPAAPAARGGRRGGGRGGGGGGGGGGAVDGPADPVLHADAPLPAGRGSSPASAVLFFTVSAFHPIAVAVTLVLRARGGVWGGKRGETDAEFGLNKDLVLNEAER